MEKDEMLDKIANYYVERFGSDGIYGFAGALSALITDEQLAKIILVKGIK